MSDSPEITYARNLDDLTSALDGLDRPGDYVATGTIDTAPPLIEVEGVGILSIPVPPEQARALAAAAEKAPYGRGDQTLIDESVRKVRQLAPSAVRLGGKKWPAALQNILAAATVGLGRPEGSLQADLYKLLVYEPGGFFLAHRDTEKAPGMLGTLIIVLPSAHAGGELIVRHDGRENTLDLRTLDPGELPYAAFYADCEHEVRPVTEGHRVCLVYNLIMTTGKKRPPVPDARPHIEAAAEALRAWKARKDRSQKIVYLLEHLYTEAALSFDALKGADAIHAQVLFDAAESAGCLPHLAMVHIEESGSAEYTGEYIPGGKRWSRWDDDDDLDDDSGLEVGEVCDENRYIAQWRDADDNPLDYGKIPLEEGEVLPEGALDEEEPDETHFTEATGNAGASFERTYLRAAVVIWTEEDADLICASAGPEAALTRLEQRVEEARAGRRAAAAQATKIATYAQENWSDYVWSKEIYARFLQALALLGDPTVLMEYGLPRLDKAYSRACNPALRLWAEAAGTQAFAHVLAILPKEHSLSAALMELWCELAELWNERTDARGPLAGLLQETFPVLGEEPDDPYYDPAYTYLRPPSPREAYEPALFIRFIRCLEAWHEPEDLRAFLMMVDMTETMFPPDDLILPALEQISEGTLGAITDDSLDTLWQTCAGCWLHRSATPPAPPTNWTLPLTERQLKGLRADLKAFALDPEKKEMRFRAAAAERHELERIIAERELDMTRKTEERGRPYTLVCTKTRGPYERACRQYEKDLASMKRLLRLPAAQHPANTTLATRLTAALQVGNAPVPPPATDSE